MTWCDYENEDFSDEGEFRPSETYGTLHLRKPLHNTAGQIVDRNGPELPAADRVELEAIIGSDVRLDDLLGDG
jgi:hypothetical protein